MISIPVTDNRFMLMGIVPEHSDINTFNIGPLCQSSVSPLYGINKAGDDGRVYKTIPNSLYWNKFTTNHPDLDDSWKFTKIIVHEDTIYGLGRKHTTDPSNAVYSHSGKIPCQDNPIDIPKCNSWHYMGGNIPKKKGDLLDLAYLDGYLYAVGPDHQAYRTKLNEWYWNDDWILWSQSSCEKITSIRISIEQGLIFAICDKIVYMISPSAHPEKLIKVALKDPAITDVAFANGYLFGVATGGHIYKTEIKPNEILGAWTLFNNGLRVMKIISEGNFIYGIAKDDGCKLLLIQTFDLLCYFQELHLENRAVSSLFCPTQFSLGFRPCSLARLGSGKICFHTGLPRIKYILFRPVFDSIFKGGLVDLNLIFWGLIIQEIDFLVGFLRVFLRFPVFLLSSGCSGQKYITSGYLRFSKK